MCIFQEAHGAVCTPNATDVHGEAGPDFFCLRKRLKNTQRNTYSIKVGRRCGGEGTSGRE